MIISYHADDNSTRVLLEVSKVLVEDNGKHYRAMGTPDVRFDFVSISRKNVCEEKAVGFMPFLPQCFQPSVR